MAFEFDALSSRYHLRTLTMDLSRTANDRKLYLCKWYFKGKYGYDRKLK